MSKWYEISCQNCYCSISVHEDWDNEPEYCSDCAWYEESCDICGGSMRIHRAWDNPPSVHKECRERAAAKWHEKQCRHCGNSIRYHEDWDHIPDYHKECEWYEKDCDICGSALRVNRAWQKPPRSHKECFEKFAPKEVSCVQCGNYFKISTNLQLKCRDKGWDLPDKCQECKHDALLIKGAIGALRDEFKFALEATIEQRGFIFTDKVAVVRSKKTKEIVAEVRMDEKGFFFTERIAVAYNPKTKEEFSKTKDGSRGVFFPKRTADTYDKDGERTHRTENVEKGINFYQTRYRNYERKRFEQINY